MSQDETSFDFSDLCDVPPFDQFPQDDLSELQHNIQVPPNTPISQSLDGELGPIDIRDNCWKME